MMFYLLPVVTALLPSLAMAFDEKALRLPKKYAEFFPAGPVKLASSQPKTEITSRRLGETIPGAGWIFFTGYAGQQCNYGQPAIIRAQATNVCLQSTDTDGEDRAFLFTCDSPSAAHIAIYNGTNCDGQRLINTVLLMDDCTPNENFDDSEIPYSYYAQCTTSSGIPFSEDLSYFSIEYSNDEACTDTLSFQGELNNACIAKNLTYAVRPVYPEYFVYDNFLCQGSPVTKYVYTGSCTTRTVPQIPNLTEPAEHYQTYDLVTGSYASSSSHSTKWSQGALAGVIVGSVIGGLLVLFVLYYCIAYKFSHAESLSSQEQNKA